jgi:hypothetical protein
MIRRSYSTTAFLFYIFENIERRKERGGKEGGGKEGGRESVGSGVRFKVL